MTHRRWPKHRARLWQELLAAIAASPLLSHGKLRLLIPELVKQIGAEA